MKPRHDIISHLRRHRLMTDGLTQQDLADAVGVTRQTILSIEKGKYSPSVGLALRLAQVLGTTVEALFELEGESDD
ncbi:helix-turn-helix transcriptional regulator [bacterium]|nr:helix-turn-helix transcriptional regulator [bacterium]